MKIEIEKIKNTLLENKIDPVKVDEIISQLEEQSLEETINENLPTDYAATIDDDGLPTDVGGDLPKKKYEYVILLNDKEGYLTDKEIAGWVVQQEENSDAGLIVSKITDAVKDQNESAKRKRNTITNLTDAFDGLKSKFVKEKGIKIKTKDLTRVIITNGKLA